MNEYPGLVRRLPVRSCVAFLLALVLSQLVGCRSCQKAQNQNSNAEGAVTTAAASTPPLAVPDGAARKVRDLLALSDGLKASSGPSPLISDLEAKLQSYSTSDGANLFLAESYIVDGDYRKGLAGLAQGLGRAPNSAEVHEDIAGAYLDLSLLDMIRSKLFAQTGEGFLMFAPDAGVRPVLLAAKAEFEEAAKMGSTTASSRAADVQMYLQEGEKASRAVTVDQARASMWLISLGKEDNTAMETARRCLNAFLWEFTLSTPPLQPDAIAAQLRQRNWHAIEALESRPDRNKLALKGTYDLGCTMSEWRTLWLSSQIMKKSGTADQRYAGMLAQVGNQVSQYANNLSIELSENERQLLRLEYDGIDAFDALPSDVETELRGKHDQTYGRVFALAYSSEGAITIIHNPAQFGAMSQLGELDLSTLAKLAQALNVDADIRADISAPDPADRVADDAGRIFDAVLAH